MDASRECVCVKERVFVCVDRRYMGDMRKLWKDRTANEIQTLDLLRAAHKVQH